MINTRHLNKIFLNIKAYKPIVFIVIYIIPLILLTSHNGIQVAKDTNIEIYFSPNGGCEEAIIQQIHNAKKRVLVQAYIFTSEPIAQELMNAKERGLEVQIILDRSQLNCKGNKLDFLLTSGIEVFIDSKKGISQNKIMIIDQDIVITGSYNFTKAAEFSNAENLLIIRNKEINSLYKANFDFTLSKCSHCEMYRKVA